MEFFDKYNLPEWLKEDLFDLAEEYPEIICMTSDELFEFSKKFYWEAQRLIEQANSIENKADTIRLLVEAMK